MNFLKIVLMMGFLMGAFAPVASAQFKITVKLDDYKSDTVILGYRLGKQTYVKDTVTTKNSKGEYVFEGSKTLEGGVYLLLVKPNNNYFEFLVANSEEQKNLYIQTTVGDGKDMVKDLKIKNSKENELFLEYLHYLRKQQEKTKPLQDEMAKAKEAKDSLKEKEILTKLQAVDEEVKTFQNQFVVKNAQALIAKLILASETPNVPKEIADKKPDGYLYFKAHYFDKFDWSDERLIRTPTMENKIEYYLEQLTVQAPDSVIISCEYLMQAAIKGKNKNVYQYVASHLLNKYAKSNIICMDAVYVYLGEKYYCGNKSADWVDSTQLEKICTNVQELKPVRCGQYAPDFRLRNIKDGSTVHLYDIKAKITLVYFWDPTCGNCTKNSKKMAPIYDKWKDKGVELVGICSKTYNEKAACEEKSKEVGMNWINVSDDAYPLAVVKKIYNIQVNPYLYVLDENKKIIWKRLDPEQLEDILKRELDKK